MGVEVVVQRAESIVSGSAIIRPAPAKPQDPSDTTGPTPSTHTAPPTWLHPCITHPDPLPNTLHWYCPPATITYHPGTVGLSGLVGSCSDSH